MPTDDDFPLILNPAFVRYCGRLNRQHGSPVRIVVEQNGLPSIVSAQVYEPDFDLRFEEDDCCILVSMDDAEHLEGWKLIGAETLTDDFSFYRLPVGTDTTASDPGRLALDRKLLRQIEPELRGPRLEHWKNRDRQQGTSRVAGSYDAIADHLQKGDTRAAIVLEVEPSVLVAAYTDELDCVAVLEFPSEVAERFRLEPGGRLVTVNYYMQRDEVERDLESGPDDTGRFQNFHPLIGSFLSSDRRRLRELEAAIPEEEWDRAQQFGDEWLSWYEDGDVRPRNGAPLCSNGPPKRRPSLLQRFKRWLDD